MNSQSDKPTTFARKVLGTAVIILMVAGLFAIPFVSMEAALAITTFTLIVAGLFSWLLKRSAKHDAKGHDAAGD